LEGLVRDIESKALKAIEKEKRAGEAGGKSSQGARARRRVSLMDALEIVAGRNPDLVRLGMTPAIMELALEECKAADPGLWKQGLGQAHEYINEIRWGKAGQDLQQRFRAIFPEPPKR
jgi:hypothetical protein